MDKKIESWSIENLNFNKQKSFRHFPSEYLLRSCFSNGYCKIENNHSPGQRVLDIGCMYVNNLVPFADRGYELYGVEVNHEMIQIARDNAGIWGFKADIRQGVNDSLPFETGFFDILLSINTLHYSVGEDGIMAPLKEFKRVGKPGSQYHIVTNGPLNSLHKDALRLGLNKYLLRSSDFRNGQEMGYFDSIEHYQGVLDSVFSKTEVSEVIERYSRETIHFFVAKCEY